MKILRALGLLTCLSVVALAEQDSDPDLAPGYEQPALLPTWSTAHRSAWKAQVQQPEYAAALAAHRQRAAGLTTRTSSPMPSLIYEGRLESDPERQRTRAALEEVADLRSLGFILLLDGPEAHQAVARAYLTAWASVYQPSGNPINENKLTSLIGLWGLIRPTAADPAIDAWVHALATRIIRDADQRPTSVRNNWDAKRIKIVWWAAAALANDELRTWARQRLERYLTVGIHADGTSEDFRTRDALHYHCGGLTPLLETLLLADLEGEAGWYTRAASTGATVRGAVEFLRPYVDGRQVHAEWVNTTSKMDRTRAQSGDPFYAPGRPFQPHEALSTLTLAGRWDPTLSTLATSIRAKAGLSTAGWQAAIVDTARR